MQWNKEPARMHSNRINSIRKRHVICSLVVSLCTVTCALSEMPPKEIIKPCRISVPREAREATFVVIYKFETDAGKPGNIRKLKNDFLSDDEFKKCISGWMLPSLSGDGVAEFNYKTGEGWTQATITGKDFQRSISPPSSGR